MDPRISRYQSRILREMNQNSENPFNSPPSSTGSHGTVTLTSELSISPDGGGTRHMKDGSIQLPALHKYAESLHPTSFKVNTAAICRDFASWKPRDGNGPENTEELPGNEVKRDKENVAPLSSPTAASSIDDRADVQKERKADKVTSKARFQPRVDNESDCSSVMQTPDGRASRQKASKPRRGNVTSLIQGLKNVQNKPTRSSESAAKVPNRVSSEVKGSTGHEPSVEQSPDAHNQTARSFFLPNLNYLNDFISGALKLFSTEKGTPVFVKHGKVYDRGTKNTPDDHADVDGVEIPDDEHKIFVSLEQICEDVHTLQEHDDHVTRQAEALQEEVFELQLELSKLKSRRDSAVGSDSDSSVIGKLSTQKAELAEKVAALQAKLDQANRKISINEIHTESYVTERDEALRTASEREEKCRRLELELEATRKELKTARNKALDTQDLEYIDAENASLREKNATLRKEYSQMLEDYQSLRSRLASSTQQNNDLHVEVERLRRNLDAAHEDCDVLQKECEAVTEDKKALKEDHMSMEQQNNHQYTEMKLLQQEHKLLTQRVAQLERKVRELQDSNARLRQMVEKHNGGDTGTTTFEIKDVRDQFERKNQNLANENAQVVQELRNLQVEHEKQGGNLEREIADNDRLVAENDRLHDQMDKISKQFEQMLHETEEKYEQLEQKLQEKQAEAAKAEEKQSCLTQQLKEIIDREQALASQLKDMAEQETGLQHQVERKTRAVEEASQITREIRELRRDIKAKPAKVTRIVEPPKSKATITQTTDMQIQDDFTQQIDLTHGSDFGSIFPSREIHKLRSALRDARAESSRHTEAGPVSQPDQVSLPPPFVGRAEQTESPSIGFPSIRPSPDAKGKGVLPGILKNGQSSRRATDDLSGRNSVRTGFTDRDMPRRDVADPFQPCRTSGDARLDVDETSALFIDDITIDTRLRTEREHERIEREHERERERERIEREIIEHEIVEREVMEREREHERAERQRELERVERQRELECQRETQRAEREREIERAERQRELERVERRRELERSERQREHEQAEQQRVPEKQEGKKGVAALSKDARRVLDSLCLDHDCGNCTVCTRITSHTCAHDMSRARSGKRTIRVPRPVPVTDRISNPTVAAESDYEDQPTIRPVQEPAAALATVLKGLKDEMKHLSASKAKKQAVLDGLDPSFGRRQRNHLATELNGLTREIENKADQIYRLYDVVEGHHRDGRQMSADEMEITLMGVYADDGSWNGVVE